jgi:STE24 endopeptidase
VIPRYERRRYVHQFALLIVYALVLLPLGWGWASPELWSWHAAVLPGVDLLTLLPFLLAQVLSWLFFYDADRALGQVAGWLGGEVVDDVPSPHGAGIATGNHPTTQRPSHLTQGGRWAYVAFQLRQKLALVSIPVLLLIGAKEGIRLLPASWRNEGGMAVQAVGMVALLAAFLGMPWIVRLILGLKPLPAGVLRDRLLASARRLNFRCSDILLWNTRSGMANAMVIGILPWLRYVVFTDRLVEDFPEDEVEAVFGHEVGHIHHRHMLLYFAFLTGSMLALGLLAETWLIPRLKEGSRVLAGLVGSSAADGLDAVLENKDLAVFPVVPLLLGYVFVVFGFLSRRCERQADVFGCRAVSCLDRECGGHEPDAPLPARGEALCPTGIRTFIRALEKVAVVNGISREKPGFLQSWQHSTIARRVAFLEGMLADPAAEAAFQRRLRRVKWVLFGALGAVLAALVAKSFPNLVTDLLQLLH